VRHVIFVLAILSAGCAREARRAQAPAPPPPATCPVVWQGAPAPIAPAMPVLTGLDNALAAPPLLAGATPQPAWQPISITTKDIPAGDRCHALLDATGVSYKKLGQKQGIETPIEVTSEIGDVRYEPAAGQSLTCDCRFAVALHRVSPVLKSVGVTRVRFSGAYSYRMSRVGRLSLHAYGLALDVHELVVNGTPLQVRRDFSRGLANGCAADAPPLNQVACRLKAAGVFRELLTPDSNADHWDHFHLGVEPLTNSPVGANLLAKKKKASPKPKQKPSADAPTGEPVFVPDPPASEEDEPGAVEDEPEVVLDAPKKKNKKKLVDDAPKKKIEKEKSSSKKTTPKGKKKSRRSARAQRTGST
jgi:hypothetical protein